MAELCIKMIEDTNTDDIYADVKRFHRGDVIVIKDDGYVWGSAEKEGALAILKVPGVAASLLVGFLAPEPGDPETNRMLQRRAFKFDVDKWEADGKPAITTITQAQSYRVARPPRVDPNP